MKRYVNTAILRQDSLSTGNADEGVPIRVFIAGSVTVEASLFSDVSGTTPIVQPFNSQASGGDMPGQFSFYVAGGLYDIYFNFGTGSVTSIKNQSISSEVSVKDFGAVGDGVTDDTTAIQSALNSGAKAITATSDTYLVTSTLIVPSDVFLEFQSATFTATTHFKMFDFASGGGIKGAILTGAGDSSLVAGSIGVGCSGTNNNPSAPTFTTAPKVEGCTIAYFGEYGIFFEYTNEGLARDNNINNIGYACIGGTSCNDWIVDSNILKDIDQGTNDAYGVFIDRKNGVSEVENPRSFRCKIINNSISNISSTSGNNGQGINTHAGVDFIISNNTVKDCEQGIYITSSVINGVSSLGALRCIVTDNVITNEVSNVGNALVVSGATSGGSVTQYTRDCVVSNNTILGYGQAAEATSAAVKFTGTKNLKFTNNIVKNSKANNIYLNFGNLDFDISHNTLIDPNDDSYSSPNCIRVDGDDNTGLIAGNIYKFEDSGLATFVAIRSVRIESGLTGLDLNFTRSSFQGIDATHLAFAANTTTGVNFTGLYSESGETTITLNMGGSTGVQDVFFSKRFPYIPTVRVTAAFPINGGGKAPIVAAGDGAGLTTLKVTTYALPADLGTWSSGGTLVVYWDAV